MLLLRGATASSFTAPAAFGFQYMLLLRGAIDDWQYYVNDWDVSIHAPLARSNTFAVFQIS